MVWMVSHNTIEGFCLLDTIQKYMITTLDDEEFQSFVPLDTLRKRIMHHGSVPSKGETHCGRNPHQRGLQKLSTKCWVTCQGIQASYMYNRRG